MADITMMGTVEGVELTPVVQDVPNSYVLGLAFDDLGRVVLINKKRPDWQRGKWNGVGGKLKVNELPRDAMRREFLEETGVITSAADWDIVGYMKGPKFRLVVLTTQGKHIRDVRTVTDEEVDLFQIWNIPTTKIIANIMAMISILAIKAALRPIFTFEYKEFSDES